MRDLRKDLEWLNKSQERRDLSDDYLAEIGETTREEYDNYASELDYGITFAESDIAK